MPVDQSAQPWAAKSLDKLGQRRLRGGVEIVAATLPDALNGRSRQLAMKLDEQPLDSSKYSLRFVHGDSPVAAGAAQASSRLMRAAASTTNSAVHPQSTAKPTHGERCAVSGLPQKASPAVEGR